MVPNPKTETETETRRTYFEQYHGALVLCDNCVRSDGHSTDAGCQAGRLLSRLDFGNRTSRHPSLSSAPSAIDVERGSTADLSTVKSRVGSGSDRMRYVGSRG